MTRRAKAALGAARRPRGAPEQTRERLIAAAAVVLNRDGFHGTDSNRIAQEAGYAAGTFYKHFADKREILLAAYERWVSSEWAAVEAAVAEGGSAQQIAARIVDLVVQMHTRWRGLRGALVGLVPVDPVVARFYREQRRGQLETLAMLRARSGARAHRRENDAVLLFTLERVCDALAQGEARDLGLDRTRLVGLLREAIASALR